MNRSTARQERKGGWTQCGDQGCVRERERKTDSNGTGAARERDKETEGRDKLGSHKFGALERESDRASIHGPTPPPPFRCRWEFNGISAPALHVVPTMPHRVRRGLHSRRGSRHPHCCWSAGLLALERARAGRGHGAALRRLSLLGSAHRTGLLLRHVSSESVSCSEFF